MSKLPHDTSFSLLDIKHTREMGDQLMWSLLPHVSFLTGKSKTVVEYKKYIIVTDDSVIVVAD